MENDAIFPLFYMPPVAYFNKIIHHKDHWILEDQEHFVKQSYRNRAVIYSPNGPLNIIVPVVKGAKDHTHVRDVKISYDFTWQRLHWMSLQTCYRSSAYFEYYEADLIPFFEKRWVYLFDYNIELMQLLLKFLKISVTLEYSGEYQVNYSSRTDYRNTIAPKNISAFEAKPYFQLFEDKHGFLPNLSIVDLIFNQGPQSKEYL